MISALESKSSHPLAECVIDFCGKSEKIVDKYQYVLGKGIIGEVDGVKYYNSSIDSSPNRTIQTLSVFEGNVVMIAGGKDKNIPYDAIGPVICEKVKVLILIGPTAEKIETAVKNCDKFNEKNIKIFHFNNYKDAVQCAYENSISGDCVLLSSASTSFDLFRNFEERGKVFKELVLGL